MQHTAAIRRDVPNMARATTSPDAQFNDEVGSIAERVHAGTDPQTASTLGAERQKADVMAEKMERYLAAFYNGDITASMLASNPALQLFLQQALQWENRFYTTVSQVLRQTHETQKAIISNIRV